MYWRIRQIISIARLTAIEAIRKPIFLLVSTTCILFIALLPLLITHTLGESGKLVRDSALALQFVCGLILGSYAACSSLTQEIRRGTVASVLSKPVSRELFFFAKFVGLALVMIVFSAATAIATLLSTRMASINYGIDWWAGAPLLLAILAAYLFAGIRNYWAGRPFVSSAFVTLFLMLLLAFMVAGFIGPDGKFTSFAGSFSLHVLPANILIGFAILMLTAIALSLAIRFDVVPTLAVCSVVFLIGLMSDYLFGRHADHSIIAAIFYRIIPNWQDFWLTDALSAHGVIPWSYVAWASVYGTLYLLGILCIGMAVFRHTEVRA